jgi:isopentenyldiphosphate isomerase
MPIDNSNELFPIVDEKGYIIGSATRGECHSGSMLLHPVVHLHVFDRQGRLYLQKRPLWKDIQPGKWDTAVGGHVDFGEETCDALRREAREELGLTDFEPEFIGSYVFQSACERELINAFRTTTETSPTPSDELDGGRFWTTEEIRQAIGKNILTPNFENEYIRLNLSYNSDKTTF